MPKRKRVEPDDVMYFTYRLFYTQDTFPPDIRTESEKILAYVVEASELRMSRHGSPEGPEAGRAIHTPLYPWIRAKREAEGTGEREFKEAVDTLTAALADEASQKTRYEREWIVQDAIDTFTRAVDATYTNVKVTDPDDWPFTY